MCPCFPAGRECVCGVDMGKVMEKQSAMALLNKRSDAYLFSHFGTEIVRALDPRDQSGMHCQYSSSAFLSSRINTD